MKFWSVPVLVRKTVRFCYTQHILLFRISFSAILDAQISCLVEASSSRLSVSFLESSMLRHCSPSLQVYTRCIKPRRMRPFLLKKVETDIYFSTFGLLFSASSFQQSTFNTQLDKMWERVRCLFPFYEKKHASHLCLVVYVKICIFLLCFILN